MNIIKKNKKTYKFEYFIREKKNPLGTIKDSNNNYFNWPYENKEWEGRIDFLKKLKFYQKNKKKIKQNGGHIHNCKLCNKKNINKNYYISNNILWEDSLYHYIHEHKIKPSDEFIKHITKKTIDFKKESNNNIVGQMHSKIYKKNTKRFIKITRNQLLILDSLMINGGYNKKYKKNNKYYYSEHSGLLDFNNKKLEKIIVSTKENKVDKYDKHILLPNNIPDFFDYEYIFHTHPPTPYPGSRVKKEMILYEFPSVNDLMHFINTSNYGIIQGSLVITPEGLYNIRKKKFNNKKIDIDNKQFNKRMSTIYFDIQYESILKYGDNIDINIFFKKVAQDKTYINKLNKYLNEYNLHIDYYPRKKNNNNLWIINNIVLPVSPIE